MNHICGKRSREWSLDHVFTFTYYVVLNVKLEYRNVRYDICTSYWRQYSSFMIRDAVQNEENIFLLATVAIDGVTLPMARGPVNSIPGAAHGFSLLNSSADFVCIIF